MNPESKYEFSSERDKQLAFDDFVNNLDINLLELETIGNIPRMPNQREIERIKLEVKKLIWADAWMGETDEWNDVFLRTCGFVITELD